MALDGVQPKRADHDQDEKNCDNAADPAHNHQHLYRHRFMIAREAGNNVVIATRSLKRYRQKPSRCISGHFAVTYIVT